MKKIDLYRCSICGAEVCVIEGETNTLECCGQKMQKTEAAATEASLESHVPSCVRNGSRISVRVGAKDHPMTEKHYIRWIALLTDRGVCSEELSAGDDPAAEFSVSEGETIYGVWCLCNIHGLWKAEVQ